MTTQRDDYSPSRSFDWLSFLNPNILKLVIVLIIPTIVALLVTGRLESILDFYDKKNQSKISEILQKVTQGEVIKLDFPLVAVDGSKIQTSTRVVQGEYSGEDVLFVVSREREL